jgi:predicted ATPase/DNA-binding XRE family transcriptional regulator
MATTYDRSFAELLQQYRQAAGLTQEELADRARLSSGTISDLERGLYRAPRKTTVALLADALDLNAADRRLFESAIRRSRNIASVASPVSPSALPMPLTRLIGRDAEIDTVIRLIQQEHARLVTLTGTAGIGKTRLALAIASQIAPTFAGEIIFVPLSSVHDADLIPRSIAHVLALHEAAEQSILNQITARFADKSILLILDNFEHLMDGVVLLVDLLAACPHLTVLVTSRVALRVRGEHRFVVPPLIYAPAGALPGAKQGAAEDLFVERAREVQPLFLLTQTNRKSIGEICRRLDGIPLAIELAAMRVGAFTPPELAQQLDQRLKVLVAGARDMPTRQQTMRDAIAWSYDLLSSHEQAVFRRLAVFVGGWSVEAACAICGVERSAVSELLLTLSALVDANLIQQEPDEKVAETRLTMLEIVREYGLERLAQQGELDEVQRRHAEYLFSLAQGTESALRGPEQSNWLVRLDQEQGNLRAALHWAKEHDPRLGLCIAATVWRYWYLRGNLGEGRTWLETFLERTQGQSGLQQYQARASHGACALAIDQGCFRQAASFAEASFSWFREIEDHAGMCSALNALAHLALMHDQYRQAECYYREALALSQSLDDTGFLSMTLSNLAMVVTRQGGYSEALLLLESSLTHARAQGYQLGIAAMLINLSDLFYVQEKYVQAVAFAEESLLYAKQLENPKTIAAALAHLGKAAAGEGNLQQALATLEQSRQIYQELNDRSGIADVLKHLGDVACSQHNWSQATTHYSDSFEIYRQLGAFSAVADCLISMAMVLLEQDQIEQAAHYVSKAAMLCADRDIPPQAQLAMRLGQAKHAIQETLLEDIFQVAWERGKTLSLHEICPLGK